MRESSGFSHLQASSWCVCLERLVLRLLAGCRLGLRAVWGQGSRARRRLWTPALQGHHLTPCWPPLLRTEWNNFAPVGKGQARRLAKTGRKHSTFINFSLVCSMEIWKPYWIQWVWSSMLGGDIWAFLWRNKGETTTVSKTCLLWEAQSNEEISWEAKQK